MILFIGNQKRYPMRLKLLHMGWKTKLAQKRATFSISINKAVAVGSTLTKGQTLYCYLAEDAEKRPLILVYLDGKPRKNRP